MDELEVNMVKMEMESDDIDTGVENAKLRKAVRAKNNANKSLKRKLAAVTRELRAEKQKKRIKA